MARYFIDTDDGRTMVRDEAGHEFVDADGARNLAIRALIDMARETSRGQDRRMLMASVRDEAGQVVYTSKLELSGEWAAIAR